LGGGLRSSHSSSTRPQSCNTPAATAVGSFSVCAQGKAGAPGLATIPRRLEGIQRLQRFQQGRSHKTRKVGGGRVPSNAPATGRAPCCPRRAVQRGVTPSLTTALTLLPPHLLLFLIPDPRPRLDVAQVKQETDRWNPAQGRLPRGSINKTGF